jgi:hypothetical protein
VLTGLTLPTVGFSVVFVKFPVYNAIGVDDYGDSHNMLEAYI